MRAVTWCRYALATGLAAMGGVAETAERPYVLDRDNPSLTALTLPAGTAAGSLPLTGRPEALVRTPDGATLLVLDQGPGKDKGEAGYQATGRSSVTIVDAATLKVRTRIELGFGILGGEIPTGLLSPDGRRLVLVCPGYDAKTPAERLARELLVVDVEKGELPGRLAVEHPVTDLSSDREVKTAFLFTPRRGKKENTRSARITLVDLAGPSVAADIELKGEPQPPVLSPDGRFLYFLDAGSPHKNPEKHVPGSLQVVSLADRAVVATLDGGSAPRLLTVDEKNGQVFFVNDGAAAQGLEAAYGELRVIKEGALATTIQTAPNARFLRFSPAGDKLYVVAPQAVGIVMLPSLQSHPMHLDRAKGAILYDDPGPAKELALSPDGKRAFVLYEKSSKLLVLDLDQEDSVAMVTTGRGGIKFMKALGAAALTAASYYSAQQQAGSGGVFFYDVYGIGRAVTSVVVRPDSRFVYVLNTQSGDVTAVKADNGEVVEKMAGGGNGLRLFPGGKRMAVLADDLLKLIDLDANQKGPELPMNNLRSVMPTPDELGVLAVTDSEVVLLDAATGAGGFKRAVQVVFAAAPAN
jgi:DNA-binding beta-propeller fold protein YncE